MKLPPPVIFAVCAFCVSLISAGSSWAHLNLPFGRGGVVESNVWQAKLECKLKNGKLVCGEAKKKKKAPAEAGGAPNDNANGKAAAPEEVEGKGGGDENDGETACPDGYIAHAKPTGPYGAKCTPAAGFCPKGMVGTPPDCKCQEGTVPSKDPNDPKGPCSVAKMDCPSPGMVGNAPDCACPEGTEFIGNKGCANVQV